MNIFGKPASAPAPGAGIAALRTTLNAWKTKPGVWQSITRDVDGIGPQKLEAFADGKLELPVEVLQSLVRVMHPHAVLDSETGMLRSANVTAPTATGLITPPVDPAGWRYHTVHDPHAPPAYPRNVTPKPPAPPRTRPGWLDGFAPAERPPDHKPRERFVRAPPARG